MELVTIRYQSLVSYPTRSGVRLEDKNNHPPYLGPTGATIKVLGPNKHTSTNTTARVPIASSVLDPSANPTLIIKSPFPPSFSFLQRTSTIMVAKRRGGSTRLDSTPPMSIPVPSRNSSKLKTPLKRRECGPFWPPNPWEPFCLGRRSLWAR